MFLYVLCTGSYHEAEPTRIYRTRGAALSAMAEFYCQREYGEAYVAVFKHGRPVEDLWKSDLSPARRAKIAASHAEAKAKRKAEAVLTHDDAYAYSTMVQAPAQSIEIVVSEYPLRIPHAEIP